jgi:hypothetical protein
MATDWANALEWGLGRSFRLPTEAELARSSIPDAAKGAENDFARTEQNIALLRALGYDGAAVQDMAAPGSEFGEAGFAGGMPSQGWTDDVRTWLDNNGYSLGVGHQRSTSSGGRPEFWGLMRDGQYVQGQSDPIYSMSDTLMEQIGMMAMVAGPLASAVGTSMAAAGGAGAASGAAGSLGSTLPTIADYGLNTLSSVGTDAAASFFGGGAGAAGGAANVLPTVVSTGTAAGGSLLPGLLSAGGALGSAWSSPGFTGQSPELLDRVEVSGSATPPTPNLSPNVPGAASWLGQPSPPQPSTTLDRVEIEGNSSPSPGQPLVPPPFLPDIPYASNPLPSDYIDRVLNQTPTEVGDVPTLDGNSVLPSWLREIVGPVSKFVGGEKNLAALVGAGLGAASGGGTQTSSEEPWIAAQPFLRNVLGDADNMLTNLRQNPFTAQQNTQYQHAFAGLDQARSAMPGLLNWGQQAMGRQSMTPSYDQLFGGGLLGQQPQQPTAQAGGPGGLLGNTQDDRMKALMAKGRSLMG